MICLNDVHYYDHDHDDANDDDALNYHYLMTGVCQCCKLMRFLLDEHCEN